MLSASLWRASYAGDVPAGRVVANHLDEFVRQFRWALTSREMFRWAQHNAQEYSGE